MVKKVKDCIYRFIEIPETCQKFIDHPLFQRLRRIKQLGVAHYVYPSATHTRFEHCLGVMHLAGVVAKTLRNCYIDTRTRELIQLAGLLHDVGHLCYSHTFDIFLEKTGQNELKHEERSVQFVKRMNEEIKELTPKEEKMVCDMIMGHIPKGSSEPEIYEIVCNAKNGLDVDKMDYLQRDAYHTGLPGFQPDYIIDGMFVFENHIAFRSKVKSDITDLYLTRKRMFTNVYYHKTANKVERIYICLLSQLANEMKEVPLEKLDDFRVETALRDTFPEEMEKLDRRDFTHHCERCSDWIIEKTPKLNGHIQGDGKIVYL